MKKLCFIIAICLLFALTGCDKDYVRIDSNEWDLLLIEKVDASAEEGSVVVACSAQYVESLGLTKLVETLEMTAVAKDGKLVVTDITNDVAYEAAYEKISQTGNATAHEKRTSYNLTFEETTGTAVTKNEVGPMAVPGGKMSPWVGEGVPMLHIAVEDGYSLTFVKAGYLQENLAE